ncbi:MAG TPA: DUF6320 domain-containing protein [Clostridiales bacterium]|nr:DUF6320 domain-containing protein [Clostridiales bacterium]HPV01725.1 DUF6320 domain-containing protein [Clostridiales bacterium]
MQIKITYPKPQKKKSHRGLVIEIGRNLFLLAAVLCAAINIWAGGKAWSVIVIWALYMAWSLLVHPDMIEYNRISQFTKAIVQSCTMLVLIDVFITSGWAANVVSIICFGSLIAVCLLLYTDFERQRHNLLPVILLSILSLIVSAVLVIIQKGKVSWQVPVTFVLSFAVLAACMKTMGENIRSELRKMFHTI